MDRQNRYAQKIVPLMVEQGLVLEDQKDEYMEYLKDYQEEF